jgi:hypothetical protein
VTPVAFGSLQVGADVIKLAVIPSGPVGLLKVQDGDAVGLGERVNVATEAVGDLLDHRWR